MSTYILAGQTDWRLQRDEEGHREYRVKYKIVGSRFDGPTTVLNTPGLPLPGTPWIIDNDLDIWAWCRADATVTPMITGEPNRHWEVELKFSTKTPERNRQRCQDNPVEDPLLEPAKISGSFAKFTEEATRDRFGKPILTSSHEQIRGPQVEFDDSRPIVKIELNTPLLNLPLLTWMRDRVNAFPMWGLPRRCIKLSNIAWERKFYGLCYVYYTWMLEFEIDFRTFDRNLLDEGTKALSGHWDANSGDWVLDNIGGEVPDPDNPADFIRFKDRNGENARVILDGEGKPYNPDPTEVAKYWCIHDNIAPYCLLAKCSEAVDAANNIGAYMAGPFATQGECNTGCSLTTYDDMENANDFDCPAGRNSPGSIHVEKYQEANFSLLGIPLVL